MAIRPSSSTQTIASGAASGSEGIAHRTPILHVTYSKVLVTLSEALPRPSRGPGPRPHRRASRPPGQGAPPPIADQPAHHGPSGPGHLAPAAPGRIPYRFPAAG